MKNSKLLSISSDKVTYKINIDCKYYVQLIEIYIEINTNCIHFCAAFCFLLKILFYVLILIVVYPMVHRLHRLNAGYRHLCNQNHIKVHCIQKEMF